MTDWSDATLLAWRDAPGLTVLEAVAPGPFPPSMSTLSKPACFVCTDGHVYWCKGNAPGAQVQQGLLAEIVAGRLASRLKVGAFASIVLVDESLLPADGSLAHLDGLVLGVRHHDNMEHCRQLQALAGGVAPLAGTIDAACRARVTAFQTWIGANDAQVMVGLTNGQVVSVDHGDCFGDLTVPSTPSPVLVPIAGVPDDEGRKGTLMDQAVAPIERLTDEELLDAVARIPSKPPRWQADASRRLRVAEWLADRRSRLRAVMEQWSIP